MDCRKSQIVRQLICQKCQISSSELSGFAWKLLDRLIRIVGMVRFSNSWTVGLLEMLDDQTVICQKCQIGSLELLEWSDCCIIRLSELLDSQTVRLSEFSDCWTVD